MRCNKQFLLRMGNPLGAPHVFGRSKPVGAEEMVKMLIYVVSVMP